MVQPPLSVAEFVLSDGEREQLARWAQAGDARLALRARIILRCAEPGVVYQRLAAELGVTTMTVAKWRKRFTEARLTGLADRARSGRPRATRPSARYRRPAADVFDWGHDRETASSR